jgi:two-component system response regulator AtoC
MKLPHSERGSVLVVDDEDGIRSFLAESLEREGHEVSRAENGAEALTLAREQSFDLVITDLRMPVLGGMELVRTLRAEQPDVEIVVLTAFGDVSTAVEALKLGAFDYLEKPISGPKAVRSLVAEALARRAKLTASLPSHPQLPKSDLASSAPSMVAVVDAVQKVAKTSATVLLSGESGTGKEVTARAIHELSSRSDNPFVAINCAVLTESLLESELFGHERGAFTGAHTERKGRIEIADGGTFFLDEVGELQPALQAKLLRAIEEKSFERLGGSKSIKVDVRWIAATHRDLRAMVRERTFRDDLYHRLAVFPVKLPALRERLEDLQVIASALLRALSGREVPLSKPVLDELRRYPWPGNIRELRNALERALILSDGQALAVEHFSLVFDEAPDAAATSGGGPSSLEALERLAIERALKQVGGNRKNAAAALGIGLRTMYEKIKRYDLR